MQLKRIMITSLCLALVLSGISAVTSDATEISCAEQLLDPEPQTEIEPFSVNPSLFGELDAIDPAHVVIHRVHAVQHDATSGNRWLVGDVVLSWQEASGMTGATRGAFIFHLDPADNFLAGAYLGEEPAGPPSSVGESCREICDYLIEGHSRHYAARDIEVLAGRIFLSGWTQPSWSEAGLWTDEGYPWIDRDLWIAELTSDLSSELWFYAPMEWGNAEALSMLARSDDLLVTGFSGVLHDTFLLLMDVSGPEGVVVRQTLAGGESDSEGLQLSATPEGWQLNGRFARRVELDQETLESLSDEPVAFVAQFDRNLELLSAEIEPDSLLNCALLSSFSGDESLASKVEIAQLRYVTGSWGSGGLAQVKASDDCYLHMYEDSTQEDGASIAIFAKLELHPPVMMLTSLDLEIESDYCLRVFTHLGGGQLGEGNFRRLSVQDLCLYQSPALELEIPASFSEVLGIETPEVQTGELPIYLGISIQFLTPECGPFCATTAKDASIDEIDIQSDYDR